MRIFSRSENAEMRLGSSGLKTKVLNPVDIKSTGSRVDRCGSKLGSAKTMLANLANCLSVPQFLHMIIKLLINGVVKIE